MELAYEAHKSGCRFKVACDDLEIGIKTLQRWEADPLDRRCGPNSSPSNKLTDEEHNQIIKIATSEEYMDLSPRQIVPMLADKGMYIASESSFYRVLKANRMLEHRGKSKRPSHKRPPELIACRPNQIWSWDITYLKGPIRGKFLYLYMFIDIYSRKIVGWEVNEVESSTYSASLLENICVSENIQSSQLTLHSDNGGPMKGATMLATLHKLAVTPTFSRPRVSNDNPYSESLFKTLKYCPEYPSSGFESIERATNWVKRFVNWYNNIHLHSGINFVTPNQRHNGEDTEVLEKRNEVYLKARKMNKIRWSKETRNWSPITEVRLNSLQTKKEVAIRESA